MLDPIYNELADKVAKEFPVGFEKNNFSSFRIQYFILATWSYCYW
jgi:hypothetical protein